MNSLKPGRTFQSSHLNKVLDYSSDSGSLTLEFVNGSVYSYSGVPFSVFSRLQKSSSPGAFFHKHIKGKYAYAKV